MAPVLHEGDLTTPKKNVIGDGQISALTLARMLLALLFGFIFGFVGSMPLAGPISVLIFGRGLHSSYRSGLAIAVGAALAESGYAFLAYWGWDALLQRYPIMTSVSRGVAALILIGLGAVFILRHDGRKALEARPERARSSLVLGFSITALNPTFIATWTAAVAVLQSMGLISMRRSGALPFASGVCAGIIAWFWLMLELLRRFKGRFHPDTLNRLLQGIGAVLVGMGFWLLARLAWAVI